MHHDLLDLGPSVLLFVEITSGEHMGEDQPRLLVIVLLSPAYWGGPAEAPFFSFNISYAQGRTS